MPIQKATATTLKHVGGTYVVIPSATIALISNPESLAILAFLLDLPPEWLIRRDHIRERFGLGRDRYDKAMTELKALGMVWRVQQRDKQGRITASELCISAVPVKQHSQRPENPQCGKTRRSENPAAGQTDHLYITQSIKQNIPDVPAVKKAGPRRIPNDWQPSEQLLQRAVDLGYQFPDFKFIVMEFKDYWITSTGRKKDWDRTFMNHLKITWERQQNGSNRHGKPKTASQILADDLDKTFSTGART